MEKYEESMVIELKEFFIRPRYFTKPHNHYQDKILEGQMYSRMSILKSLDADIKKYVPKYLSGWNHEEFDFNYGKLYFGIKDNGDIVGIPFDGFLTSGFIKKIITNSLLHLDLVEGSNIDEIIENIRVSVSEVKPKEFDVIGEYKRVMMEYKEDIRKHEESLERYLEWHNQNESWHLKLVTILNDKNEEFYNWTLENCDDEHRENILNQIKNWVPIDRLNVDIMEVKDDPTTVYYWLCLFKDMKMTRIKKRKPHIHHIRKIDWKNFYGSPYKMNSYLKKNNPDIRFYLICINLPNLRKPIFVKRNSKMVRYHRRYEVHGPASSPID